ncbi:MAG TPA: hypothetical protein VIP80_04345 [Gemmatimonadales bacterium]|jgi:hypothetical protein
MSSARWRFTLLAAVALGAACSNDPTSGAPRAGTLTLRLSTPRSDDGALLFEVSGPPIDTAVVVNGSLQLFTRRADGSTVVGAVVGGLTNGALVTLRVPDVGAAGGYTARVLEVADRQNVLRTSLAGYALTVTP